MSAFLPDGTVAVQLSAHAPELLRAEAHALFGYVERRDGADPESLARALAATRTPRRCRALIRAGAREELAEALSALAQGREHSRVSLATASAEPKTAFVFPGQGNQLSGMGRLFYERSSAFREEVERCEEVFQELFQISPLTYLLATEDDRDDRTSVVQPALFMQMAGLAAMWRGAGVEPAVTLGHSQGEIAAAYVGGLMSLRDAVRVVTIRADSVERVPFGDCAMGLLGLSREECEELLARHSGWAEVSVVNAASTTVVSGDVETIQDLVAHAESVGVFARQLRVRYPAHTSAFSRHRAEIVAALEGVLDNDAFLPSPVQCIGSATAQALGPQFRHSEYWYLNLRNRVRFDRSVGEAVKLGVRMFIEIAEHPTLAASMAETLASVAPNDTPAIIGTSRRTATDLGEFAKNVAAALVLDARVSFATADSGPAAPPRGFPHAPMAPQRFWSDPIDSAASSAPKPPERVQVVREKWELARADESRTLGEVFVVDLAPRRGALADQLVAAAQDTGLTASAGDLGAVGSQADTVILLLPEHAEQDARDAVDALAEHSETFLRLLGSNDGGALGTRRRYLLVTTNGERVTPGGRGVSLSHGALAAAFRSVAYEHPQHRFAHLDLEAEAVGNPADWIFAAARRESEPELAVRGGALYAKRWSFASQPASELDLSHVVVIGGTGSFGLELCAQLCAQGSRAITLVSRSGRAAVDEDALARLQSRFDARIEVLSCDVTDEAAVRELASGQQDRPASLILHAAVRHGYALAAALDRGLVERACAAKAIGAQHVLDFWPRTVAAKVVLFSSVAASVGGRGQILYAAANRMLDLLADSSRARGVDCVSVQWGAWRSGRPLRMEGLGEMTNEALLLGVEDMGLVGMEPAEAVRVGFAAWRGNVAAASADWAKMQAYLHGFGWSALVEELTGSREPVAAPAPDVVPASDVAPAEAAPMPEALADRVRYELAEVMGMTGDMASIDGSVPLVALGLDSLLALELRKRIRAAVSHDVPLQQIMGGASLDDMVGMLTTTSNVTESMEVNA